MNFLDIKAGDLIQVGAQIGFRFWRYAFSPTGNVRLLSFVVDSRWYPNQAFEARSRDGEVATMDGTTQGVHAFKSMDELMWSIRDDPANLRERANISGCDGAVIGTVALWGIVWEHARGYRAQYARPKSFTSSYGRCDAEALSELRLCFRL
jgi:hypothetical protein